MRVLIVGGLGYVGGRLANYLYGHHGFKISLTTTRPSFPAWSKPFDVRQMNILEHKSMDDCLSRVKPDVVVHLGALQQSECQANRELALKINHQGTENLVRCSKENGVKRFIYFSTFQVYGNFTGEITEQTPPDPKTVYAETKLLGEETARKYGSSEFKVLALRLANAYGYPCDTRVAESVWTLAFNAFCRKAIEDGRLTIKSNQYRNFIPMSDVVRVIEFFLTNGIHQWQDGLFNLGSEDCLNISQAAENVARIYEEMFPLKHLKIEGPTMDLEKVFTSFHYNIEKLNKTGFIGLGDIDWEIRQTLEFCYKHRGRTSK
ncbi:MAG: NAD-dependent epimerase/dehydratase family protein [Candidatus Omnitrophota bacterium]